jgi:hypothetical protein
MVPEQEDFLTDPFRIIRGLCPSGTLARTIWQRDPPEPDSTTASAGAQGIPRALGSRNTAHPGPTLSSCPANDASQDPGTRRQAPGYRCPGTPWRRSRGVPQPTTPSTGSRLRRDTRRQIFPRPPRALGLPGPRVSPRSRPPSPLRRLQKVSPGGARSKPTTSDT